MSIELKMILAAGIIISLCIIAYEIGRLDGLEINAKKIATLNTRIEIALQEIEHTKAENLKWQELNTKIMKMKEERFVK